MEGAKDVNLIKNVLETTGLSCEDLISILQKYKTDTPLKLEGIPQENSVSSSLESESVSSSTDQGRATTSSCAESVIKTKTLNELEKCVPVSTTDLSISANDVAIDINCGESEEIPTEDKNNDVLTSELKNSPGEVSTVAIASTSSEPCVTTIAESSANTSASGSSSQSSSNFAELSAASTSFSSAFDVESVSSESNKNPFNSEIERTIETQKNESRDHSICLLEEKEVDGTCQGPSTYKVQATVEPIKVHRKTNSSFIARLYEKVSSIANYQSDEDEEYNGIIQSSTEILPQLDDSLQDQERSSFRDSDFVFPESIDSSSEQRSTEASATIPVKLSLSGRDRSPSPYTDSEYTDISDKEDKNSPSNQPKLSLVVYDSTDSSNSDEELSDTKKFKSPKVQTNSNQKLQKCDENVSAEKSLETNIELNTKKQEDIAEKPLTDSESNKVEPSTESSKFFTPIDCQPSTSSGITHEDHDYFNGETDFEESEDLRAVLRQQLLSLRTMKKTKACLADIERRSPLTSFSAKRKRKSVEVRPLQSLQCTDKEESQGSDPLGLSNDNSLISQADETDFLILDVTGGVDRLVDSDHAEGSNMSRGEDSERSFASIFETSQEKTTSESINDDQKMSEQSSTNEPVLRINVRKDITKETFSKDPGIEKAVSDGKSPFVSDSLDNFLSDSARLEVSYPIPKLRAEEGISEKTKKQSPFDDLMIPSTSRPYKPRGGMKEKPNKKFKVKTLAEMRRLYEKNKLKLPLQEQTEGDNPPEEEEEQLKRNNFVMYSKKKIHLLSSQPSKKYATIENHKTELKKLQASTSPARATPRKLSLLSTLSQSKLSKVSYRPGPLSKKSSLLNSKSSSEWTTEVKTMPKIYLEVEPEPGKSFHPSLFHLLPTFDDAEINAERADFALTALRQKNDAPTTKQTFSFEVPYKNNQNKILVRKKKQNPVKRILSYSETKEPQGPEDAVKSVIDDLIRYVEIKEIENTIFKEDDTVVPLLKEPTSSGDTAVTSPEKSKQIPGNKMKRLELEMRRLNCKVINVTAENTEQTECKKPHCRMGCVCQSLSREAVYTSHCQLLACMFGCTCIPRLRSRKVLSTNSSLSEQTVNQLDDQAKRDLAKVEREFTQTLIHTDKDVILVGTTGRNNARRSSKAPRKYSDYVKMREDKFESFESEKEEDSPLQRCTVDLIRLDLEGLIPYCMYHRTHDCYCKGERGTKLYKRTYAKSHIWKETQKRKSSSKTSELEKQLTVQINNNNASNISEKNSCARIRSVFPQYLERNQAQSYNENLRKMVNSASGYKTTGNQEEGFLKLPANTVEPIKIRHGQVVTERKVSKRKQNFEILQEEPDDSKSKPAPKKPKMKRSNSLAHKFYTPVFDGEIKVPLHQENHELLEIIGNQYSSLEYLRIIHWDMLIKGFRNMNIAIWCKESTTSVLLCNSADKQPPKNFRNILYSHLKPEIVDWIVHDELPSNIPRKLMHLILTPKGNHYLIAGYALRTMVNNFNKVETIKEKPNEEISVESASKNEDLIVVDEPPEIPIAEASTKKKSLVLKSKLPPTLLDERLSKPKRQAKAKDLEFENLPSFTRKKKQSTSDKVTPVPPTDRLSISPKSKAKKSPKSFTETAIVKKVTDKNITKSRTLLTQFIETQDVPSSSNPDQKPSSASQTKSLKCAHKDMFNQNKVLILTNKSFPKRNLHMNEEVASEKVIQLALPKVSKQCKWIMIFLQSDFSFLSFNGDTYSIKYNDLMDVVKLASNIKTTIALRNKDFSDNFKHPLFGIFCLPNYKDRIIVGPYLASEEANIGTLRYLQGNLIDTNVFNEMSGKKNSKNYKWIYEIGPEPCDDIIIDITQDEEQSQNTNLDIFQKSLLCPPFVELLTPEELERKWVNRYILTSIPNVGYLEARQADSMTIEVFWPTNDRAYRFPNVTFAKNCLIQYFSQLFYPVPNNFKISVVILTNVNYERYKPINTKFFKLPLKDGPYICGDFGYCEMSKISKDLMEKYNVLVPEELIPSNYTEIIEEGMVRLFGMHLMLNEEIRKCCDSEDILKWAAQEIDNLEKGLELRTTERRNLVESTKKKRETLKKLKNIDMDFATISKVQVPSGKVAETIEISDSDSEDKPTPKQSRLVKIVPRFILPRPNERSLLKSSQISKSPKKVMITKEMTDSKTDKPKKLIIVRENVLLEDTVKKSTESG